MVRQVFAAKGLEGMEEDSQQPRSGPKLLTFHQGISGGRQIATPAFRD
jgi:hypothetical protein